VLTGNADDAADLVQDALLRLGDAWHRVRRKENPEGYVRMIMARRHIDRWRRVRREHLVAAVPDGGYSGQIPRSTG
jgi:DNA-directed RNA polymerase specialized sigma24 family protein